MMKKIAVFTSGGDSPGMNACIRAVVRTALYHNVETIGIKKGYDGMINGDFVPLISSSVSNILQKGGTILKTARSSQFMTPEGRKQAFDQLQKEGIEGLVAIGGNGTFTGAEIFFNEFGIPTVGAPGTIDNDLFGTDYTIGYDTALNTAVEAIDKIRDTADSHDRAFFIEVMGRHSGQIAMATGISCGAEFTFIPEIKQSVNQIINILGNTKKSKRSYIFVVAEGDEEGSAQQIAQKVKDKMPHVDARVTILGHIQRGGAPTAKDRILASKMGMAAVNGLLEGKANCMVGIDSLKTVYIPFHDAIFSKKDLNPDLISLNEIMTASK